MNFDDTLKQIDAALAAPAMVPMTKAQFDAYVADQIAKAKKDEDDCADPAKKKATSRKRLEALRSVVATVAKASWEGANGTMSIPVFEEANLTAKTEESDTTVQTPPAGNSGTQADGASYAAPGGAQEFAKTLADIDATLGGASAPAAPPAPPAPAAPSFAWPDDITRPESVAKAWGSDLEPPPAK